MSLVATVYVPSGIVMAADSRMTVMRTEDREESGQRLRVQQQLVLSDSAYKIVRLRTVPAGIGVYDSGIIDNQPVESHVRRFEEEALTVDDDVNAVAQKFLQYFEANHKGVGVGFMSPATNWRARPASPTSSAATLRASRRSAASTPPIKASCSTALSGRAMCWSPTA